MISIYDKKIHTRDYKENFNVNFQCKCMLKFSIHKIATYKYNSNFYN